MNKLFTQRNWRNNKFQIIQTTLICILLIFHIFPLKPAPKAEPLPTQTTEPIRYHIVQPLTTPTKPSDKIPTKNKPENAFLSNAGTIQENKYVSIPDKDFFTVMLMKKIIYVDFDPNLPESYYDAGFWGLHNGVWYQLFRELDCHNFSNYEIPINYDCPQ